MRHDERRAGLQAAANFHQRRPAFIERQEVHRQQAGRCIERAVGRSVGVAVVQRDLLGKRAERFRGEVEHGL
ncbi:hypothetical protein D9M68_949210 [compost metagenome]